MKDGSGVVTASLWSLLLWAGVGLANPQQHELTTMDEPADIVGDVRATPGKGVAGKRPATALQDTCWIADWTFEGACGPTQPGWERVDLRITDMGGVHYWKVNANYDATPYAVGNAASLTHHDLCWVNPYGYDNDWYMGIRFTYSGGPTLTFTYAVDSEADFDFLFVETDSACASFGRVNYGIAPGTASSAYRDVVWADDGIDVSTINASVALTAYGAGTHCGYITFRSDGGVSNADDFPSTVGAAAVVDDILVSGGGVSEDFTVVDSVTFQNMGDGVPFGQWGRTFSHITDNAICTENESCAWLHTDDTTPSMALTPGMAFGPGGFVVKSWLDEAVISPWVDLTSTSGFAGTVLSFRLFGGNFFGQSRILQNWAVRGLKHIANTDTPAANDSIDCVSPWGHAFQWNAVDRFDWVTRVFDMETHFDAASAQIQLRFRVTDRQWFGYYPPTPSYDPGPGPYWDRVRIGRRFVSGPVFSDLFPVAWLAAQDAFPATVSPHLPNTYAPIPPGPDDIFRTVPWSMSADQGYRTSPNVLVGDSIICLVLDVTGQAVSSVRVYGRIVQGPHTGKAPPPLATGPNSFFVVPAFQPPASPDRWFVDIDDEYLLPGDELRYFWYATDVGGGAGSLPAGLESDPSSITIEQAEAEIGGLFEVKALPTVIWDQDLLNAIAASSTGGKVDPYDVAHPEWRDDPLNNGQPGRQQNCILYYQIVNLRRQSGDPNRTSFMYTLDELGYRGSYDVYDHMGLGETNNQLGSRATGSQCRNYSLLVYDAGTSDRMAPILPDGPPPLSSGKVNMVAWFQDWLDASGGLAAITHTLWMIGSNTVEHKPTSSLVNNYMGVTWGGNVTINVNPDVLGTANFAFQSGPQTFVGDLWALNGGCPTVRHYDDLVAASATVTHSYGTGGISSGEGAIAMNRNAVLDWNTIMQSHPWFDIRDPDPPAGPAVEPENDFLLKVLQATLPSPCQEPIDPSDTPDDGSADLPRAYRLAQNVPNPFNPVTTIRFDLPRAGRTSLEIYDPAGRLVRRLVDEPMAAGRHSKTWTGLDEAGKRVSTGVYFYRLTSGTFSATHKMIVIK